MSSDELVHHLMDSVGIPRGDAKGLWSPAARLTLYMTRKGDGTASQVATMRFTAWAAANNCKGPPKAV